MRRPCDSDVAVTSNHVNLGAWLEKHLARAGESAGLAPGEASKLACDVLSPRVSGREPVSTPQSPIVASAVPSSHGKGKELTTPEHTAQAKEQACKSEPVAGTGAFRVADTGSEPPLVSANAMAGSGAMPRATCQGIAAGVAASCDGSDEDLITPRFATPRAEAICRPPAMEAKAACDVAIAPYWALAVRCRSFFNVVSLGSSAGGELQAVLPCVHASGVDVTCMSLRQRCAVLWSGESPWTFGAASSADLISRLVPDEGLRQCILTSHIEFSWRDADDCDRTMWLRNQPARNCPTALLVDGIMLRDRPVAVRHGARIDFCAGLDKTSSPFLSFCALLSERRACSDSYASPGSPFIFDFRRCKEILSPSTFVGEPVGSPDTSQTPTTKPSLVTATVTTTPPRLERDQRRWEVNPSAIAGSEMCACIIKGEHVYPQTEESLAAMAYPQTSSKLAPSARAPVSREAVEGMPTSLAYPQTAKSLVPTAYQQTSLGQAVSASAPARTEDRCLAHPQMDGALSPIARAENPPDFLAGPSPKQDISVPAQPSEEARVQPASEPEPRLQPQQRIIPVPALMEDTDASPCAGPSISSCILVCVNVRGRTREPSLNERQAVLLPTAEASAARPACIGRQHQEAFFDSVLGDHPFLLAYISRSHLEIWPVLERPGSLVVANRSLNPVFVGEQFLETGEVTEARLPMEIGFLATISGAPEIFLQASLQHVRGTGGHVQSVSKLPTSKPVVLWLELGGTAVREGYPPELLRVPCTGGVGSSAIALGRDYQPELFHEAIFQTVARWISRDHFHVEHHSGEYRLLAVGSNPIWRERGDQKLPVQRGEPVVLLPGDRIRLFTGSANATLHWRCFSASAPCS